MKLPTISVENFGPIRKGTVELRPLTIFIGPSNTGKSWLAMLIYSLFSNGKFQSIRCFIENLQKNSSNGANRNARFPENLEKWYSDSREKNEVTFSEADYKTLSACMDQVVLNTVKDMEQCFVIESYKELRRWYTKKETTITVNSSNCRANNSLLYKLRIFDDHFEKKVTVPKKIKSIDISKLNDYLSRMLDSREDDSRDIYFLTSKHLIYSILNVIFGHNIGGNGNVYLPAGRVGLIKSFNTLFPSIIERFSESIQQDDEIEVSVPRNISDFLTTLAEVRPNVLTDREESVLEVARRVEKNLLEGQVIVKFNCHGQPFFYYKPFVGGKTIPLNRTSSAVTQLAPLVLFLRYTINKRNLIIWEEPELNLHPEKQVRLVHEIVSLVQKGYKLVITTHSEWITEALSNIIAFNGTNGLPRISSNDVGVWNFEVQKTSSGSVVNEIEWSTDHGGYQTEFEAVSRRLYNEWIDAAGDTV